MPEYPIMDSIVSAINAQEPWPDSVQLFQPYEVEQILLPDQASCLSVQAFLKMCNLPFEVEMRWNAEFMSPSGRVPFIKCGEFVVSELEPIVQFTANKGVSLCNRLATEEKAEMRAYMSLITNVLVNAELYITWLDKDTFNAVTKVRNSSVYPWPLGWIQTRSKRNNVAKRLKALHWHDKTLDQVLADVEQCCNSLSQRLGDKDYFFGTRPTPLDALVYGHMRALLSANGPKAGKLIKPISSALLRHVIRVTSLVGLKLTAGIKAASVIFCRCVGSIAAMYYLQTYELKFYTGWHCGNDNRYNFITELIEDIIDKVDEIIIDHFARTIENDFEVISFSTDKDFESTSKNESEMKINEGLDTIEENDITETSLSIDDGIEDVIHIINEDVASGALDSDGIINDRLLSSSLMSGKYRDHSPSSKSIAASSIPDINMSASNKGSMTSFDDRKTTSSNEGSKATLKIPSDEELSVDCLLQYLRKRNAIYNYSLSEMVIADID